MACEYFIEGRLCRCSAVRGVLIPSIYERNRFCRTDEGFERCPTYRACQAQGAQLSQDVYYELWMPTQEPEPEEAQKPSAASPAV